jgi:hypothetical protein
VVLIITLLLFTTASSFLVSPKFRFLKVHNSPLSPKYHEVTMSTKKRKATADAEPTLHVPQNNIINMDDCKEFDRKVYEACLRIPKGSKLKRLAEC